jgi:Uma2 family endonuclease
MSVVLPMAYDDFVALGESRNEYINGALRVNPSPRRSHQDTSRRIANYLADTVPAGFVVCEAWSWKPGADEFIPDVMLLTDTDEDVRYTGLPELVVEILSSDRSSDLVIKSRKYAEAGLQRYWVVDVPVRTITVFGLDDGGYEERHLLVDHESAEVDLGPCTAKIVPADLIDSPRQDT